MKVAFFKIGRNPLDRKLVRIDRGSNKNKIIKENIRAGMFSRGTYVAFVVSKSKRAYKIDGVPVIYKGTSFNI